MDRLASVEGIRLERHYVYKYCSPTRSSFLSGRLPVRHAYRDPSPAHRVPSLAWPISLAPCSVILILCHTKCTGFNQVGI